MTDLQAGQTNPIFPRAVDDPSLLPQQGFWSGIGQGFAENVGSSIRLLSNVAANNAVEGVNPVTQEQAEAEGAEWFPGMTDVDLGRIVTAHDDAAVHADMMNSLSTAGKVGYFAGSLAGGLIDPINLIPFGSVPEEAGLIGKAAYAAIVGAGISVPFSALEQIQSNQEQGTFGPEDWIKQAAISAGLGAIAGSIGHVLAPREIPETTEQIGAAETNATTAAANAQTAATVLHNLEGIPQDLTPDEFIQHLRNQDIAEANKQTVANLERDMAGLPQASGKLETDLEAQAPKIAEQTITDPSHFAFPDQAHQALFELNAKSDPAQIEATRAAFHLGNDQEALALADQYRQATMRRYNDGPLMDAETGELKVPAPKVDGSLIPDVERKSFTDPDLAASIQNQFAAIRDPASASSRVERDMILQDALQKRAATLKENDEFSIPDKQPDEGVLVQRDSRSNEGQLKEVSTAEWWRRQQRRVTTGDYGPRINAPEVLFNRLAQLTPDQYRWLTYKHMNISTLERLYGRFVDNPEDASRAEMAEGLYQAVHAQSNVRTPVTADAVAQRFNEGPNAEVEASLTREMQDYRGEPVAAAMDKASGIADIQNADDAATYIKKTGYLESVREANPEAVRNIQDELTKLKTKKSALVDAFNCLIGG